MQFGLYFIGGLLILSESLARMFLQDNDVFIFDEATSALDQYSENIVQDAIRSIPGDKTIIVAAHRESSLKLCDRIIAVG